MKRYFALSRTYHGMLDIAMPAFCAILLLGRFPEIGTTILAMITAICGYTSIYALNDVAGLKVDKEKFLNTDTYSGYSVETTEYHHPIARGILSLRFGALWMIWWGGCALVGAYFLNPFIILFFLIGGILEFVYCRMLKITYWRFILSGIVKTCGPCAAVLVANPPHVIESLLLVFALVFFWEIGGQNIPADWNDHKEDRLLGAKTIPVCVGPKRAALIILSSIVITIILSCVLLLVGAVNMGYVYLIGNLGIGYYLLLLPAMHLYKTEDGTFAAVLFDKASYYPFALLIWTIFWLYFIK